MSLTFFHTKPRLPLLTLLTWAGMLLLSSPAYAKYDFKVTNSCPRDIKIALDYEDYNTGEWDDTGRWELSAGESRFLADNNDVRIKSNNMNYYYYAESTDTRGPITTWSGHEENDKDIAKAILITRDGKTKKEKVLFRHRVDKKGDVELELTCRNSQSIGINDASRMDNNCEPLFLFFQGGTRIARSSGAGKGISDLVENFQTKFKEGNLPKALHGSTMAVVENTIWTLEFWLDDNAVADLSARIMASGHDPIVLIGHSMGGGAAMFTARILHGYDHKVAYLATLDPVSKTYTENPKLRTAVLRGIQNTWFNVYLSWEENERWAPWSTELWTINYSLGKVGGAKNYPIESPSGRYHYEDHKDVVKLWKAIEYDLYHQMSDVKCENKVKSKARPLCRNNDNVYCPLYTREK